MADNQFTIPGAKAPIDVVGAEGIRYRLEMNGERLETRKGAWIVPLAGGKTASVRQRGVVPGFATLVVGGEEVFNVGGAVPTPMKVLAFLPIIAVMAGAVSYAGIALGVVVAILLVLMNIQFVKNTQMPTWLRYVMPIANSLAGAAITYVIAYTLAVQFG